MDGRAGMVDMKFTLGNAVENVTGNQEPGFRVTSLHITLACTRDIKFLSVKHGE